MSEHETSETKVFLITEAILESISDAVVGIDPEKRILWLNRAAEKISGLSRAEAMGRSCSAVLHSSVCGECCILERSLKASKPIIDAPAFLCSGGKRIPVILSLFLMNNGTDDRVIGAMEIIREPSATELRSQESRIDPPVPPLTTQSPLMQKVLDELPTIGASPITVVIEGETGTGKELVARTIHNLSPRRRGPFVAVNCGAFPDTLLASELFGYKKGAFTGAHMDKAGRFALAKGGTLFLDDIEVMSPAMQVHLLRVLQEHIYEPLGATRSETTDARVILASNEDLFQMVRKGTFRQDLYYRVNVARLELPPLRRRKEDIPLIVEQMVERFDRLYEKRIQGIEPKALNLLAAYNWPGNVRELQNAIEHAIIKCDAALIGIKHLPHMVSGQEVTGVVPIDRLQQSVAIRAALVRNDFNRTAAAKDLGINRSWLFRKMKSLGILYSFEKDGRSRFSRKRTSRKT